MKNDAKPNESESQIERFRKTARTLEADEDMEHFRNKLRVIARHKPKNDRALLSSKKKKADD